MRNAVQKELRYRQMRERVAAGADGRLRKPADIALEIQIGEPMYTVAEVAAMFKIGTETARRRMNRLPGVVRLPLKPGGRAVIRVPQSALVAFQRGASVLPERL